LVALAFRAMLSWETLPIDVHPNIKGMDDQRSPNILISIAEVLSLFLSIPSAYYQ